MYVHVCVVTTYMYVCTCMFGYVTNLLMCHRIEINIFHSVMRRARIFFRSKNCLINGSRHICVRNLTTPTCAQRTAVFHVLVCGEHTTQTNAGNETDGTKKKQTNMSKRKNNQQDTPTSETQNQNTPTFKTTPPNLH